MLLLSQRLSAPSGSARSRRVVIGRDCNRNNWSPSMAHSISCGCPKAWAARKGRYGNGLFVSQGGFQSVGIAQVHGRDAFVGRGIKCMGNVLSDNRSIDDGSGAIDLEDIRRRFAADESSPKTGHRRNHRQRTPAADRVSAEGHARNSCVHHLLNKHSGGKRGPRKSMLTAIFENAVAAPRAHYGSDFAADSTRVHEEKGVELPRERMLGSIFVDCRRTNCETTALAGQVPQRVAHCALD